MRRRATGGHAPPLIDRHVDDDRPRLHELEVIALDQMRCPSPGDQHAADDEIGPTQLFTDRVPIGEKNIDVGRADVVEVAEPFEVRVEEADASAEAGGHLGRVGTDRAGPENRDMRRRHTRHPAEEDAPPHLRFLEVFCPLLDAHPPGHLAHRHEQRQPAPVIPECLVGHRRGTRRQEPLGQPPVGGEVEVGEQHLPRPEQGQLRTLRLLHLDDEVGVGKHLGGRVDQPRPTRLVGLVGEAGARPGGPLDHHGVASPHQLLDAHRQERHPILVALRLLGDSNDRHGRGSGRGGTVAGGARQEQSDRRGLPRRSLVDHDGPSLGTCRAAGRSPVRRACSRPASVSCSCHPCRA